MKTLKLLPLAFALLAASCSEDGHKDRLVMHYDHPADYFEESLPLGNGRLGALVYGGTGRERISLNDITLWTGEPDRGVGHPDIMTGIGDHSLETLPAVREALENEDYALADKLQQKLQGHYSESYQPLGNLWIEHLGAGEVTGYRRSLDLGTATANVAYSRGGKEYEATYFLSAPDSATEPPAPDVTVTPSPTPSPTPAAPATNTPGTSPAPVAFEGNAYINTERVFFRKKASYTADYYALLPFQWEVKVTGSTKII